MIVIGLGGNLTCETFGAPRKTCGAALSLLQARGIRIAARSRWYESAPVPISDQPWYVNGIAAVETELQPEALIAEVLEAEAEMGRRRSIANAPRTIDIDVIAYNDRVIRPDHPGGPEVPHPRMAGRAFVILPLMELAPDWRHPASGTAIKDLAAALPADQVCRPMDDADGLFGTEFKG